MGLCSVSVCMSCMVCTLCPVCRCSLLLCKSLQGNPDTVRIRARIKRFHSRERLWVCMSCTSCCYEFIVHAATLLLSSCEDGICLERAQNGGKVTVHALTLVHTRLVNGVQAASWYSLAAQEVEHCAHTASHSCVQGCVRYVPALHACSKHT